MAQRGAATHKWQFLENNGKFVDYQKKASLEVEKAYASWMVNPHIDVRSVQSGDWEYMVDFNLNQQQNMYQPQQQQFQQQGEPARCQVNQV